MSKSVYTPWGKYSAGFMGSELKRVKKEQRLEWTEVAALMRCDLRLVHRYRDDSQRMPLCRWRLLLLELGIERPDWTPAKRRRQWLSEFV